MLGVFLLSRSLRSILALHPGPVAWLAGRPSGEADVERMPPSTAARSSAPFRDMTPRARLRYADRPPMYAH